MTVGIVGGGFTGLTAAWELLKKGYSVDLFENQDYWGGLASAFEVLPGIFVERFYHHLFTNDQAILDLCRDLGISEKLRVLPGRTSHLYAGKIYPLDSPWAVLRFSPLNLAERLRFGLVTLYLKLKRSGKGLEQVTAAAWLGRWYGQRAYEVVWRPLLQGKFATYSDSVSMLWLWARVKKRTEELIYPEGGFQTIIDALAGEITRRGGRLHHGVKITQILPTAEGRWVLAAQNQPDCSFDRLIFTPSLRVLTRLVPSLPLDYKNKLNSIEYLWSQVVILVLNQKLSSHYWINIGDTTYPFLVVGEQSNLLGLEYYQGKSIVYLGNYLAEGDYRLRLDSNHLIDLFWPYLKKINPQFDKDWIEAAHVFLGPAAQPVVDLSYSVKLPSFGTPLANLYLATMAQVYPWDRGTNYAVRLAQDLIRSHF